MNFKFRNNVSFPQWVQRFDGYFLSRLNIRGENCKMETAYDSDDSVDLPDFFDSSQPSDFKEGDIVWAKYRQFYWPSLIRKVYKRDKKASLWYLDSPRKCFKVHFKSIHSFKDRAFSLSVQKEASNSPIKVLHEKVLSWTLCYIQRRGNGLKDDPGDYFDSSKHYLSLCDLKAGSRSPTSRDDKNQSTISFLRKSLDDDNHASSEEESVPESDEEELKVTKFYEGIEVTDDDYYPEDKARAIVDCIIGGKLDKYLLGIFSRKIPSQRQSVFDDYVKKKDRKLLTENYPLVLLKDKEKYFAIYKYLQNYYESFVEKGSSFDQFNYVMWVWYPDALDKAVALIESNALQTPGTKRQLFPAEGETSDKNVDGMGCFGVIWNCYNHYLICNLE